MADTTTKGPASGRKIAPAFADFQNPNKVFHHMDRVEELRNTGDTRPVHMTIGLNNYCNHKCAWCYINWTQAGRRGPKDDDGKAARKDTVNADDRIIEAVGEARAMGLKAVTIVGDGEPTLHPRFADYLQRLAAMGLDIGLFSNLSSKDPAVFEAMLRHCFFIRASVDAGTAESHRKCHGTDDFDQVIANLTNLARAANRPILGVQFVVNHWNYAELPQAARMFRDIGVDYLTIKPAYKNILNPDHPDNEVATEDAFAVMREAEALSTERFQVYAKYPQFLEVLEHATNDGRYYQQCLATPLSPYLDEDGAVEMCGNLKGRGFTMGNVHDASFAEIWQSARRRDCLSRIDLCRCPSGCRLDPLNKALWDAMHPDRQRIHPNFL